VTRLLKRLSIPACRWLAIFEGKLQNKGDLINLWNHVGSKEMMAHMNYMNQLSFTHSFFFAL
jgi:hypothetical protein